MKIDPVIASIIPAANVEQFTIAGLSGRRLVLPAKAELENPKDIVFFYGHHGSLERVYSVAEYFNVYGNVTTYDMPGFGGMDSFKKIGLEPNIENYADFFYTLLKAHKTNTQITIVGMSLSFTILTRMFQKYPDITEKVDKLVSFVGFGHYLDFSFYPKWGKPFYWLWWFCSLPFVTFMVRILIFNRISLRLMMGLFLRFNPKLKYLEPQEVKKAVAMEMDLWRRNDLNTHFKTYLLMFTLNLSGQPQIPLHLYDMSTQTDQYFDSARVRRTLKGLYKSVTNTILNLPVHTPSLISTKQEVAEMIPKQIVKEVLES